MLTPCKITCQRALVPEFIFLDPACNLHHENLEIKVYVCSKEQIADQVPSGLGKN
jgi:hypothetical protein